MAVFGLFLNFCGFIFLHFVLVAAGVNRLVMMLVVLIIGAIGASLGGR